MNSKTTPASESILKNLGRLLPDLETLYKDLHSHPELSMQETRTAGLAADWLHKLGYEVMTGVGKTGVVGLLRNGNGPTIMLRADMDALPIEEATGLPYASKVTKTDAEGKTVPVGHMCGHDIHVTWLAGASTLFAQARDSWRGTLMVVFQPGEETAQGAQAMIDDNLLTRFQSQLSCLASTSCSERPGTSREVLAPSRRRRTAFRSGCSAVARTGRCHKPPLIQLSWLQRRLCGFRLWFPARWLRPKQRS